ncbi:hypothetical protein C6P40_005250, partial [Pichia californica]
MDTSQLEQYIEFPIDFKGQEITELALIIIITAGSFISLLFAFALQNITIFLYPFTAFSIIAALVCLPSYSKYKENPIVFLKRPAAKQI